MNDRSVFWWIGYLGCHKGFIFYCRAKREGHLERCQLLEAKFERLAELYSDFGDIFESDILRDKKAFSSWLRKRRKLFDSKRSVRLVTCLDQYENRPATVLIEVPLYKAKSDTLDSVKSFLDRYYDGSEWEKAKGVKAERPALDEVKAPKYQLSNGARDLSIATIKALRKSAYVAGFRRKRIDGKVLSITDTVLAIKQDPKNPFRWSMSVADQHALLNGTFKRDLLDSSEVAQVKKYRRDFDAYVRNTIHGRFPDNS